MLEAGNYGGATGVRPIARCSEGHTDPRRLRVVGRPVQGAHSVDVGFGRDDWIPSKEDLACIGDIIVHWGYVEYSLGQAISRLHGMTNISARRELVHSMGLQKKFDLICARFSRPDASPKEHELAAALRHCAKTFLPARNDLVHGVLFSGATDSTFKAVAKDREVDVANLPLLRDRAKYTAILAIYADWQMCGELFDTALPSPP